MLPMIRYGTIQRVPSHNSLKKCWTQMVQFLKYNDLHQSMINGPSDKGFVDINMF